MTIGLELTRSQILAFRRRVASLDERLPHGQDALRRAAWAGLQDSMPRAALLSINARMAGTEPESWEDPSLIQVWGPRFSAYVVAKCDLAVFTLGRLPSEAGPRKRAQDIAARLQLALAGRRMTYGAAARAMEAKHPSSYCKVPTASSLCPTRVNATRCGHRVSGQAPCSSKVRLSAFGGAQGICSRSSHGNLFPTHSVTQSKQRQDHCPCLGLPDP